MATLQEIIYSYKNLREGGITSSSTKISDEQVADIVHYYRAKLIRQEIDRGQKLDPQLIQPIYGSDGKGIEVERVKFNRGEPLSGKTVFRTKERIPRAIETNKNNLVTFVGHNLLGRAFQRSTPYKVQLDVNRAITGAEPKWFEFDERIYVITEDPLQYITIQLVAENPSKVVELNGEIDVYQPFNYEYPISATLRDSIFKLMIDAEDKVASIGTDNNNDGLEIATK